jgi:hypothetical protein
MGFEGSFMFTTAWKYPPGGEFEVLPVYMRGELTGGFGGEVIDGNETNPAVTLRMLASFVVPCEAGSMFTASGSLTFDMDAFAGFATAAGSFACSVGDAGGKLATIDAQMRAPINIAQIIRIESVTVHVVITKASVAETATTGKKYYLAGTVSGIVTIPSIANLTLFGSIRFDTKAKTATILGSVVYEKYPVLNLDATVMVRVGGACADDQFVGYGNMVVSVSVLDRLEAHASLHRHCVPAATESQTDRYNWDIDLNVPELSMFGGAFVASDLVVSLRGIEGVSDGSTDAGSLLWNLASSGSFATNASAMDDSGYDLGALKKFDCNGAFALDVLDATGSMTVSADLNISCAILVGGDGDETPPIFDMVAVGSVTYPMTKRSEFIAEASINNLGGENGLSVEKIIFEIAMEVDDSDDSTPEMTIFGSAEGVVIAGVDIGRFTIAADAYKKPAALGAGGNESTTTTTQDSGLYWKGVITADVGLPLENLQIDGAANITFNTLTNELTIAITLDISVGGFTLALTGEFSSVCSEIGFMFTGTLTFPADADWPLDLHKKVLTMSVTKYCRTDAEFVYVMKSSFAEPEENSAAARLGGFALTPILLEMTGKVRFGSESHKTIKAAGGDNNPDMAAALGEKDVPLADIDWALDLSGGVTYGNDGTGDLPKIVPNDASFLFDFHVDYTTLDEEGATAKFLNARLDMEVAVSWDLGNGGVFAANAAFSVPCQPGPDGGLKLDGSLSFDSDFIAIDQATAFANVACRELAAGDMVLNIGATASKISLGGGVFSVSDVSISITGNATNDIDDVTFDTIKSGLDYKFTFEGTVALGEDAKYGSFVTTITYEDSLLEVLIEDFTLVIPKDSMKIALEGRARLLHTMGSGKMCSNYGDFTVEGSITATGVPFGEGKTIDLPTLEAKYTWDCESLFRLEITLALWDQGYKYYKIGSTGLAAVLPRSASLVVDKSSAIAAGFINIEVEFASNCALNINFLLAGLAFQYIQVECADGGICQSMEDLSTSLVKCKAGDDACDCSDDSCESALANANVCEKMEKSDNLFFSAIYKILDRMKYSFIGLRLQKTTAGVTIAGVVRGIPIVPGVVDLELGFSVHLTEDPKFHIYATLARAANIPSGGSMSIPTPPGANEGMKKMMALCGTIIDKLLNLMSTIESVSVAFTTHAMISIPEAEQALFNPSFQSIQGGAVQVESSLTHR